VESSSFEDDCRTLLGANSYVLFTLDKLIYKIVKQIESLLTDETAAKLLSLAAYEHARTAPFVEGIYHANASVLLVDEPCYRFGSARAGARLTLQLMEAGLDKADLPAGIMEAQFQNYLEGFLQTAAEEGTDRGDRPGVYLGRAKVLAGLGNDEGGDDDLLLGEVSIFNSLECKISCSNSKVSYVLDTEDVFHRRPGSGAGAGKGRGAKGRAAAKIKQDRSSVRFHRWLAEKEAEMPEKDVALAAAKAAADAEALPSASHAATAVAAAALAEVEAQEEAQQEAEEARGADDEEEEEHLEDDAMEGDDEGDEDDEDEGEGDEGDEGEDIADGNDEVAGEHRGRRKASDARQQVYKP